MERRFLTPSLGNREAARAKGWHVGTADEADALWLLDYAAGQLAGVAA